MHTATSFGSSFLDASPTRLSPNRSSLRPHRESLIRDPYESPNRKLALEFNLRLSISDSQFNEKLDQDAAERAKRHAEQLAYAEQPGQMKKSGDIPGELGKFMACELSQYTYI